MWNFFLPPHAHAWGFFYLGGIMNFALINNTDMSAGLAYKIARIVYAQTAASSLVAVEALTSMIKNLSAASGVSVVDIISDETIFDALSDSSPRHVRTTVFPTDRGFQMCLRVAKRMLRGGLPDGCYGATRFHHSDTMPEWARARGYIADIDGMLFYL